MEIFSYVWEQRSSLLGGAYLVIFGPLARLSNPPSKAKKGKKSKIWRRRRVNIGRQISGLRLVSDATFGERVWAGVRAHQRRQPDHIPIYKPASTRAHTLPPSLSICYLVIFWYFFFLFVCFCLVFSVSSNCFVLTRWQMRHIASYACHKRCMYVENEVTYPWLIFSPPLPNNSKQIGDRIWLRHVVIITG